MNRFHPSPGPGRLLTVGLVAAAQQHVDLVGVPALESVGRGQLPDALEKAELAGRVLRERLENLGLRFDEVLIEFVGDFTHPLFYVCGPPEFCNCIVRDLRDLGVQRDRIKTEKYD